MRQLALVAMLACASLAAACNVNDYCLNCGDDDIGDDDGPIDGGVDANDGSVPPDACIQTGAEVCNGLDDDCDGSTDEDAAQVGNSCGIDTGLCMAGVFECNAGELECSGVAAAAEECDNEDNDCDGNTDEGNPEGGAICGTDTGECVAGVTTCTAGGVLDCVGDSGMPGQTAEACDGRDNDCDGDFDEDVPTQGDCGFPTTGECEPGELTCVGGAFQCVGGTGPTFEECDDTLLDTDCDGNDHNGYDLANDVRNCGACEQSCVGTLDNATEKCTPNSPGDPLGHCDIASCDTDFWDDNNDPSDGCEYGPCEFQGPVESCNDVDDDCDNVVDENLNVPSNFCDQDGACAGTVPSCTDTGWDCVYGGDTSHDADGNLEPEALCDGIDNDCDGDVDESHTDLGDECLGTGTGVCQSRGHKACNDADPDGPTICEIDTPGGTSSAEICDALDNDCDGSTDENASTLQSWVSIGGGRSIMKHEASHPDARDGVVGSITTHVCSRSGVQPWTSVTQPQAEAACATIGARLCTEQEWHRACAAINGTTWPVAAPTTTSGSVVIEAEDYFSRATGVSGGVTRAWVPEYVTGYSGISALRSSPDTGADVAIADVSQSPRLDYQVNFGSTGTHYVWVRMRRENGNQEDIHIGINTTLASPTAARTVDNSSSATWQWVVSGSFNVTSTGTRFVSLWMSEDGSKVDKIAIAKQNSTAPSSTQASDGGHWSFASNPDTYVGTTCNGADNGVDAILNTGAEASCFADRTGTVDDAFDLSGNVKEWALERTPGVNPIRGGAYNNIAEGISCSLAFTAADDTFFFDNVGFRCCK